MIHYHGGPITPETAALRAWKGRHAFVSWADDRQLGLAGSVCQSFALDNGAFSFWRSGTPIDWDDYYRWTELHLGHPACDWAVIPDVIGGSEEENDELLRSWPWSRHQGIPVWHLNESIDRLIRLAREWPRVALGSAAEYDVSTPSACLGRLYDALPHICRDGTPTVKLHGLRMLNPAIVTKIPLASADSTNVARNIGLNQAWTGTYQPATKEARAEVLVERMEQHQSPHRMTEQPLRLFDGEGRPTAEMTAKH